MKIYERKEYGDHVITFDTFDDFTSGGKTYVVVFEKKCEVNGWKYTKLINSWRYKNFKSARKRFNVLKEKVI